MSSSLNDTPPEGTTWRRQITDVKMRLDTLEGRKWFLPWWWWAGVSFVLGFVLGVLAEGGLTP
jgi:hypothetical protein